MTKSAVICAFSARYIRGFLVLVESLRASPRLHGLDRIVITTDAAVRDDPAVRSLAAEIRLVTEEDLAVFQPVRRDLFHRGARKKLLPHYPLMKWFGFDDYGYDSALYLDTDLINTTNADEILDLLDGADLVGGPTFPRELTTRDGATLPLEETDASIRTFCDGKGEWPRRLNAGLLLFNRRLMSKAVRTGLIALASEVPLKNDQIMLRRWLQQEKKTFKLKLVSPYFNFNAGQLGRCYPNSWAHHFAKMKFLHYIQRRSNPWEMLPKDIRWYHQLWLDLERNERHRREAKAA